MKEFAFTVDLKNDAAVISKYKKYHKKVWPEVLDALKEVGILDMQIYLWANHLFMHIKTSERFDPKKSFQEYSTMHPKIAEWEELMDKYQAKIFGSKEGEKWVRMEKIFQL